MAYNGQRLTLQSEAMRTLLCLIAVGAVGIAQAACLNPRTGAAYDELIDITPLGDNEFRIAVPTEAGSVGDYVLVTLAYSREHPDGKKLAEHPRELETLQFGDWHIAETTVQPREGMKPYIYVGWQSADPDRCGVSASSAWLPLE